MRMGNRQGMFSSQQKGAIFALVGATVFLKLGEIFVRVNEEFNVSVSESTVD